jgi:mannose-6-phosphate isomerase-like protein (cupin superfamily)
VHSDSINAPTETQPPRILHLRAADAPELQLGPYGITSLISATEEGVWSAYRVRIAAHETTAVSYHRVAEEIYFIIAGTGTCLLDGQPHLLQTGDFLRLPPGTTHGFVTGETPLEMLNLHSPAVSPGRDVYFEGPAPEGFD